MSSAAEAEVGTVRNNGKVAIPSKVYLDEMGHTQGPTPYKTDNNLVKGFMNKKICKKRSKVFAIRFHRMIDRV